jgi:hypothetical protein
LPLVHPTPFRDQRPQDASDTGCSASGVEALNLYRSLGFVEVTAFEDSEMDAAGLARFPRYMELAL